ncbi:MAG: 3-demethylubiquinone-9 3-O-methyltransferase [Deltaproteobacteria bacterium]|nr:3-demethylubiquinone-9 3-O-methyltransferase [Deltaproteobacteria bacterium]
MLRFSPPARINVIDVYDDRAQAWWDFTDPIFEPLHAMVPARAAYLDRHGLAVDGRVVVDVGCGGGYVSGLLAARGARVLGVDLARNALLAGRAYHAAEPWATREAFAQASATRLPVADGSVDFVSCTDVLVHVPVEAGGPRAALAEVARVLKPGGALWFSTINSTWLARFVLITLGEDVLRFVHKGTHDPSTFLSPTTMRALLHDVGLALVAAEGVGPVGPARGHRGRITLKMGRLPTTQVMWQGHAIRKPS